MMKILTSLAVLSLAGLILAAPTSKEDDDKVTITKSMYIKDFVKYKSEHEIVSLLLPINSLNFDENESSESNSSSDEEDENIFLFFVEADFDDNGKRIDQGLYSLVNGTAKKLLDHGREAAASGDDSKDVFFGAKEGLYIYNKDKNSAEKYGNIDEDIIGIAKEKSGDVIYILTAANEVFKVTDKGNKKEKIEDVKANQIVLDYENNLYYYSDDKQAYVRSADGIKKIEGLPENPESVTLVKPPFILETGAIFVVDTTAYIIYPNGTSETSGFDFKPKAKPTAYAPEAALVQYYAYDKKIYEFNILAMILGEVLDELKNFLNDKTEDIRSLASKKKSFAKRP